MAGAPHLNMTEKIRRFIENKKGYINLIPAMLLLAAIVLLYGHSLWNPLVFDDKPFLTAPILEQYGRSLFHLDLRWFSYASFGWTYRLFGLDWFWYRIGNLGLHALNSIFLFLFFSRLLAAMEQPMDTSAKVRWPACLAALIFALHPIAVYGVAYLMERSIIMATLFGIVALICYLEGLARDKKTWFIWSATFYFLAVFSKEHSIMIPGVAVALTLLLHKPSMQLARKLYLPFMLYAAIGLLVILRTKGLLGAPYEPFAAEMLAQMSEHQQGINIENAYFLSVITEGWLFFKYLLLWIIPYAGWMSVDIRQPFAAHFMSWPELPGFLLFLAYPVLAAKLLLKGGQKGLLGFGLLFPWILFLTELSSVRIQEPFVLYRSYLWMSGLPLALLASISAAPRKVALILLSTCCLMVAIPAWNRLDTFSDNFKLWSDVVEKNHDEKLSGVERGYNNRGFAQMESGHLQDAMQDFVKSVALNPKYPEAHLNIGIVNFRQKRLDEALQSYDAAIALKPEYGEAYLNRGVALLQMGRYPAARDDFERAIQLSPRNADAYLNRGIAYLRLGKTGEAINDLDEAIHINPGLISAYMNRGIIAAMQGHADAALGDMDKAVRIDGKNADAYFNRGIVHGAMGHHQKAVQDYTTAIELNPDHADAYVNRGSLYMLSKRIPEAIKEFDRALQINPNQENGYLNRANAYASQLRYQDAMNDYDKVIAQNASNGHALLNRGFMLLALNRKNEARESFRKSCETGNREGCARMR